MENLQEFPCDEKFPRFRTVGKFPGFRAIFAIQNEMLSTYKQYQSRVQAISFAEKDL